MHVILGKKARNLSKGKGSRSSRRRAHHDAEIGACSLMPRHHRFKEVSEQLSFRKYS